VHRLYDTAIKSFQALEKIRARYSNLKLKVNIVYLEQNRDSLDEIVSELSRAIGFDRIQLTYPHEMVPPQWNGGSAKAKDIDDYREATNRLGEHSPSRNILELHSLVMRPVQRI